jgi:hypothetical protein
VSTLLTSSYCKFRPNKIGKPLPASDPTVAARLDALTQLGQELRSFADSAFLHARTAVEVVGGPETPAGIKLVRAAQYAGKQTETNGGALVVVVVNGCTVIDFEYDFALEDDIGSHDRVISAMTVFMVSVVLEDDIGFLAFWFEARMRVTIACHSGVHFLTS